MPVTASEAVTFVSALWRLLEPTTSGGFDAVDRFLLRAAVEAAFIGVNGATPAARPVVFREAIDVMLSNLESAPPIPLNGRGSFAE